MYSLTVIVPFFNEEKFLAESIERILAEKIFEKIILVDDASTDGSLKIAQTFFNNYDEISLISTSNNSGKGNAIQEALSLVSSSHVIIHDADLEYFPDDIPEMYNLAKNNKNTLILGSRTIGNKKRTILYKKTYYGQKMFALVFSLLNKQKLTDIASCYWLIETKHLRKMNIAEKGFSIEIEVLSNAVRKGISIIEVPIKYEARSYADGKKIKLNDAFKIFLKIISSSKLYYFVMKKRY